MWEAYSNSETIQYGHGREDAAQRDDDRNDKLGLTGQESTPARQQKLDSCHARSSGDSVSESAATQRKPDTCHARSSSDGV